MFFPRAAVAALPELPAGAGDGPAVAGGAENDPTEGGTAAETAFGGPGAALGCALADASEVGWEEDSAGEADASPRLVT